MNDYDVIVVGARCGGSPTAMLLARAGYRVLLVDRAGFPSDTLSTHYIHQPGVACLKRWGLLDRVAASNCPPVRAHTFDVGPFALKGKLLPFDGVDVGYAPRRTVFDQILIEAAAATGAEVREHFSVGELLFDGERVTGIRGHAAGGPVVSERARLVIGADGIHSLVARAVQAAAYHVRPARSCAYYSYWSGVPLDGPELYPRPGRMIVAGPTNDELTLIIAYWPVEDFHVVRADIDGQFMTALEVAPGLAARVRAGARAERYRGTADLRGFFRVPFGPGWALVGDAGYHKDPITARGVTDAFLSAELLAAAIDAGLSGRQPLDDALAGYQRARDAAALPIYAFTHDLARLEPPSPDMQRLFAALRENQEQTDRFINTVAGVVPIPEFFGPDNLASIFAAVEPVAA